MNFSATAFWTFENSDTQYHGDLYLNKKEGGVIVYIRVPNEGGPMSYFNLPLEIPLINGTTINGAKICLLNCSRISTQSRIGLEEVYGYRAKYMLEDVNFENKEKAVFSRVRMSLPGIIKWGNVSNYVKPVTGNREVLIGLNPLNEIEIYSSDEYTLSYDLTCSYPFRLMEEEITLEQTPYLIVESKSLHSLDWFLDVIIKMKRLIEIAMGMELQFDKMITESPEIKLEFDNGHSHIKRIEVVHALAQPFNRNNKSDNGIGEKFLFTLNELIERANFSKWQENLSILEPIIELHIDDLYNLESSASRHFLNMAQALETYHSRFVCNGKLANYKERVEKIIERRPESFKQEDRDFLLKGSHSIISLKSRIADLLLADFRFRFYTSAWDFREFPEVVGDTRNYYTHYNPSKEDKALKDDKLINAYYILRNILEYYILKELGFDEDFIHERTRERTKKIMINDSIKRTDEN
ncbi:HEPN domain-containing protein [Priestia sp. 179-F W1.4 NHS]|uniref:ApeA N-terminal domain 1-containing protein n=1 Tax=Priestia sp. 179-F W1.4 NHS TaxID=3374296 RepID=UPI0038792EDF